MGLQMFVCLSVGMWRANGNPNPCTSDGSGSKSFDSGRVSHLWFGLEFGKFPLKMSNFSIFSLRVGSESTRVKAKSASYLLWVKSKLGSGRVKLGPSLPSTNPDEILHYP